MPPPAGNVGGGSVNRPPAALSQITTETTSPMAILTAGGLGIALESSREAFLRLCTQGGDYTVVDLHNIEQDLSLRLRLLDDFAR